jgi:hypothetical protein
MSNEKFEIPLINETLQDIIKSGVNTFTELDISNTFLQIPLGPETQDILSFTSPTEERFSFTKMLFGINLSLSYFQRIMSSIIGTMEGVKVYLDNIIIYTDKDSHESKIREVLKKINKLKLKISETKCKFSRKNLRTLGHIISKGKIRMDEAIFQLKEVKKRICKFGSRAVKEVESRYSITKLECLGIAYMLRKCNTELLHKNFILYCDHSVLESLMSKSKDPTENGNSHICAYYDILAPFLGRFQFVHIKGHANIFANALSRLSLEINEINRENILDYIHTTSIHGSIDRQIKLLTKFIEENPDKSFKELGDKKEIKKLLVKIKDNCDTCMRLEKRKPGI